MAAPVFHLPLHPSRHAAVALCAAHVLASLAILMLGMPSGLALAGVAVLGVNARVLVQRHAGTGGPEGITALELEGATRVRLVHGDGRRDDWEIGAAPLVTPVAVLLSLRQAGGGRRALWLPGDACPAEGHRRLRVLLRWGAPSAPQVAGAP